LIRKETFYFPPIEKVFNLGRVKKRKGRLSWQRKGFYFLNNLLPF